MRFRPRITAPKDELARILHDQFKDLEFDGPAHLVHTLQDHLAANALPLRAHTVAGHVIVARPTTGIILKFHPI